MQAITITAMAHGASGAGESIDGTAVGDCGSAPATTPLETMDTAVPVHAVENVVSVVMAGLCCAATAACRRVTRYADSAAFCPASVRLCVMPAARGSSAMSEETNVLGLAMSTSMLIGSEEAALTVAFTPTQPPPGSTVGSSARRGREYAPPPPPPLGLGIAELPAAATGAGAATDSDSDAALGSASACSTRRREGRLAFAHMSCVALLTTTPLSVT